MISCISHMTFIVHDLDKATDLFKTVFDAKEVYSSGNKMYSLSREKFFLIGDIWLCIMEGTSLSERTYNHIAFKIEESDFDKYLARIKSAGVDIRYERSRIEGEGRSIYFYDFDNHLFELHTGTLEERLKRYEE